MLKEIHPIIIPKVLSDKNKTHINKKKTPQTNLCYILTFFNLINWMNVFKKTLILQSNTIQYSLNLIN